MSVGFRSAILRRSSAFPHRYALVKEPANHHVLVSYTKMHGCHVSERGREELPCLIPLVMTSSPSSKPRTVQEVRLVRGISRSVEARIPKQSGVLSRHPSTGRLEITCPEIMRKQERNQTRFSTTSWIWFSAAFFYPPSRHEEIDARPKETLSRQTYPIGNEKLHGFSLPKRRGSPWKPIKELSFALIPFPQEWLLWRRRTLFRRK